ncbi:MAG TPA: HEAT repeat domain-containing protein [Gemmataceae bacterium]|nr:HEAT repeat domain-containing protein [Gemmataceae bacterium]
MRPGTDHFWSVRRLLLLFFLSPCHLVTLSPCHLQAETDADADEETLRAARLPADGPSLLTVFRKRTPNADTQARIKALIAQLGSDSFTEREEASEELAGYGVEAAGLLRAAVRQGDLEIRWRARDALAVIEQNEVSAEVLIAALHVLGRSKPPRLAEVLLDYVPHAANADVTEEVCLALIAAAPRDGEADPWLARALTAASPIQRGVAGAALCRGGSRKQLAAVRRLLRDPDADVRRRIALALLEARDKAAVPVLIDLLAELPQEYAEHIESMLLQIAGDTAPVGQAFQPDSQPLRQAGKSDLRDAWADWWRRQGDALDLAKIELAPKWRGYTLAVCTTAAVRGRGVRNGMVRELDTRGRTRWEMKGLAYPVDAQVLDEHRVLVAEYRSGQVTERNHSGDILRRIDVPDMPLEARRLPNGNTFIVTRSLVMEVDRAGKEVWRVWPKITIAAACPLPRGQLAICALSGELVRIERTGKVLAEKDIATRFRPYGTHIQALPNGHVLVPLFNENKVSEFDRDGREVWSVRFARPASAQRLPNGRTLVAGLGSNTIVELDKNGREVKSISCPGPLMCVSGR